MPLFTSWSAAAPESSGRDRRRLLTHVFVWLPAGLWLGVLLVGVRVAVELATRHRAVGTATSEEASLFLWETTRDLPALAWGALVAGPLVAALTFRFGRGPTSRWVVTVLGAGLATAGIVAQVWSRGDLEGRAELALDAPLVIFAVASILVVPAVRLVDVGARVVGPLEDAPALLRPLLGGGATAGALLVVALAAGLPPIVAAPPEREVLLALRDLRLAPETIRTADATAPTSEPLAPRLYAHSPGERRTALRCTPPTTLSFEVADGASHLLAEFAVDDSVRRTLAAQSALALRCDVLLDGVVAAREELRITPLGELAAGGLESGTWRPLGGPRGVPISGVREIELRLEVVGPRDPELAGPVAGPWVGFSPLVQVLRKSERFAAPTPARPSLVVVRLTSDVDAPPGAWPISLRGGGFPPELRALATELLSSGAATAALGPGRAGRNDGFEAILADPADLSRWLESHAGLRSFLWLDLAEPAVAAGRGRAPAELEAVRSALAGRGTSAATVWVFLDRDGTTARVGDFRHATELGEAAMSPEVLRRALAARALGSAPSVSAAWERAVEGEASGR